MRSGIAPLDLQLGELHTGRVHLLTGGPGTGKTTACLQFLQEGLCVAQRGVLITMDRTSDLAAHARSIGLDLAAAVRENRLLVLRFRTPFTSMIEAGGLPDPVIDDLNRTMAVVSPVRVVVDPLTPFLTERAAGASVIDALTTMLEEHGLTSLLTYPNDVSAGYDARVSPVVQRAAAIAHLTRNAAGLHYLRVVQARWRPAPSGAVRFVLQPHVEAAATNGRPLPELENAPAAPKRSRSRKHEAVT